MNFFTRFPSLILYLEEISSGCQFIGIDHIDIGTVHHVEAAAVHLLATDICDADVALSALSASIDRRI